MKYSYLKHIWHDPNCPAWNRDHKTNKPFPHLVKRNKERGIENRYPCFCGYDEDLDRLLVFKRNANLIPIVYLKFITKMANEYHTCKIPVSQEMIISSLSSRFALSPEYCRKVVLHYYGER